MNANVVISFRIPRADERRLAALGERYGLSPGQMAARVVIERLGDSRHEELLAELGELSRSVSELKRDLATATTALLVDAGRASPDEARQFVESALSP